MNSKLTCLVTFALGTAFGGVAAWRFARKTYERIAEEEIASVKESYSRREAVMVKPTEETPDAEALAQQPRESVVEYAARLRKEGYLPKEGEEKKEEKPVSAVDAPYVISPEEFGELDGYSEITLTYYSDGTLTDENDELIDDPEEIVGSDFHNHFGEYEEDSVHVRNDKLRCDYEILFDQRPYAEVLKAKPYLYKGE